MEKFAVDLDAVLDEFEFHEDQVSINQSKEIILDSFTFQAEKQNNRPDPKDTGFFSPTVEDSSLLNSLEASSSVSNKSVVTGGSDYSDTPSQENSKSEPCLRYDLPPSSSSVPSVNDVKTPSLQDDAVVSVDTAVPDNANISSTLIETKDIVDTTEDENHVKEEVTPSMVMDNADSEVVVSNNKSLLDELNDASSRSDIKHHNNQDDYVDTREVDEYLEQLKEEQDNYVDEEKVAEYLK